MLNDTSEEKRGPGRPKKLIGDVYYLLPDNTVKVKKTYPPKEKRIIPKNFYSFTYQSIPFQNPYPQVPPPHPQVPPPQNSEIEIPPKNSEIETPQDNFLQDPFLSPDLANQIDKPNDYDYDYDYNFDFNFDI